MPGVRLGPMLGGLSLLICLCAPSPALADESAASGWEATLSLSATTVLPGEPVLAACTLTYTGEDEFSGYASFGRAAVNYTGPSGEQVTESFATPAFRGISDEVPPARPVRYQRGFTSSATLMLLYTSKGFLFEAEGTGQLALRAEIWQSSGTPSYQPVALVSAPVTITVQPLPADESAAYGLWHDEQVARLFLTGEAEAETQAKVKRLATEFPKSAYAKYALMALARQKQDAREHLGSGYLAPKQREEARRLATREVELLEQAQAKDPGSPLDAFVLYQLMSAARWLSDDERQAKLSKYATALVGLPDAPPPYREDAVRTIQAVGAAVQGQTLIGSAAPVRAAPSRTTSASRPAPPKPAAAAPHRHTPT